MASRATMERILAAEPTLNVQGFGAYDEEPKSRAQRAVDIRAGREEMLTEVVLKQFEAVRAWLRPYPKAKGFLRHMDSYGLKHVAEWDIDYTFNGAFIAAAIAEGFRVERIAPPGEWPSLNARIGIRIGRKERAPRRWGDGAWWDGRNWRDAAGQIVGELVFEGENEVMEESWLAEFGTPLPKGDALASVFKSGARARKRSAAA